MVNVFFRSSALLCGVLAVCIVLLGACDSNGGDDGAGLADTYSFTRLEFDPDGSGLPTANVLQDTLNAGNSFVEFVQDGELVILARFRDGSRSIINGEYNRDGDEIDIDLQGSDSVPGLLLPNEFTLVLEDDGNRLVTRDEEGLRLEDVDLGAYNAEVYGNIRADGRLRIELQSDGGGQ